LSARIHSVAKLEINGLLLLMFKKKFILHLLAALVIFIVVIWTVLGMLNTYTRHGKVYIVPDFTGQDHEMVIQQYEDLFTFIISDSIFKPGAVRGSVLQQEPPAGSKVKQGRNIYLITVSQQPEKVRMPNLVNLSLREALVTLETIGLEVNEIRMTEHFARNAIVAQYWHGAELPPDEMVFRGIAIDLVVGDGGTEKLTPFPMIYGKEPKEARRLLHSSTLNVGKEFFLDNADSSLARVYKLEPYYQPGKFISPGSYVTIYYKSADLVNFKTFINDSLFLETNDSSATDLYEEEL
jgi:beta-lactam-binding protein with PASTA domain